MKTALPNCITLTGGHMDMDKQIPQSHIIRYIFVVVFIFVGLFSVNSNAFHKSQDTETTSSQILK